jgi:hypothetical protein
MSSDFTSIPYTSWDGHQTDLATYGVVVKDPDQNRTIAATVAEMEKNARARQSSKYPTMAPSSSISTKKTSLKPSSAPNMTAMPSYVTMKPSSVPGSVLPNKMSKLSMNIGFDKVVQSVPPSSYHKDNFPSLPPKYPSQVVGPTASSSPLTQNLFAGRGSRMSQVISQSELQSLRECDSRPQKRAREEDDYESAVANSGFAWDALSCSNMDQSESLDFAALWSCTEGELSGEYGLLDLIDGSDPAPVPKAQTAAPSALGEASDFQMPFPELCSSISSGSLSALFAE